MNDLIAWITAEADPNVVVPEGGIPKSGAKAVLPIARSRAEPEKTGLATGGLVVHTFPVQTPITSAQPPPFAKNAKDGPPTASEFPLELFPTSRIEPSSTSPLFDSASPVGGAAVRAGFPAKDAGNGAPSAFSDDGPGESECEVLDNDRERRIYRWRCCGGTCATRSRRGGCRHCWEASFFAPR